MKQKPNFHSPAHSAEIARLAEHLNSARDQARKLAAAALAGGEKEVSDDLKAAATLIDPAAKIINDLVELTELIMADMEEVA